jgi:hypothetical protein
MVQLWDSIEKVRFANANSEQRYFIPESALFDNMAEKGIKASLKSLDFPLNRIKDLASGIL